MEIRWLGEVLPEDIDGEGTRGSPEEAAWALMQRIMGRIMGPDRYYHQHATENATF